MSPTKAASSASRLTLARAMIALLAVVVTAWVQWSPPLATSFLPSEWLRDQFIRMQATEKAENRVVVIDINEASLKAAGPWPWPRERLADLVEKLIGPYEARGVALDLVFPEPGSDGGDQRLAMLAEQGPVVMAQAFDYETRPLPVKVGTIAGGMPATGKPMPVATGFIGNHSGFGRAAHPGNIGFVPDPDGTIRRLPMLTRFDGRQFPTLSLALVQCCSGKPAPAVEGMRRIPFERELSAYTVISASSILDQSVPPAMVAGKLALVGSSSLGLSDRVSTPLDPSTPGMLIHAIQASRLLDEQAGQAPARLPGTAIALAFSLVVALAAAYAFPRLSAVLNVGLLAASAVAWLALAYIVTPHDPDLAAMGPLASILFLLSIAVPYDWQVTQRKSRQLLDTLRQYVAQAVVDELLRRDLKDPLSPQRLDVTTLIADMEGYTHQVESLSMEESGKLTRDFLDCLTRPVIELGGTLDKYTGDGLVAFWGAPLPLEEHADRALDAAGRILKEVQAFSAMREQMGFPKVRVRIGIESGLALAGDFGSSFRSIYTAVGDSVNTASRLEQMAREYPHSVIIGEGTAERAKRHELRFLAERMLRGKEKPTKLFTLAAGENG
ncbi:CHASE2 domain-containing protein [Noviherbaspirillum galbum]|uniref:Adenylate/guanylate cyclase domain-containing protein n=1 Tax=Noviherbaspirillum galbum TaxID=2709383 RepID=A0A6B3SNP8_9BURK|nr:adenylate/guanylate cyclase domain-containing protein [Noviherbaspirillum galbum]NEX60895.1 adenylate/guanylate cyclase domain-containing protein [Noviherbaspirillum galbum]